MLLSHPSATWRYPASVKWAPSKYSDADGSSHAVAAAPPHATLSLKLYGPPPPAAHRQNVLPEPYSAKSVKWGRRVSHSLRCEATGPIALGRLYDTGPIGYRAAVALTGSSRSSAPRE